MKTPPPPIWGTTLEEDFYDDKGIFYDHDEAMEEFKDRKRKELEKLEANGGGKTQSQRAKILKLKRKVVYTYEYSDESDKEEQQKDENNKNAAANSDQKELKVGKESSTMSIVDNITALAKKDAKDSQEKLDVT